MPDLRNCCICGNPFEAPYRSYPKLTCNKTCSQALIKQVNLSKYGVENPQQVDSIRQKTKDTNLQKYGAECFLQTDLKKEKTKQTNLERYGTAHPLQNSEILLKQKNTNIERYGVSNPQKLTEVKQKSKNTRIKRYGVEHMLDYPPCKEKLINTTLTRYGVKNFSQTEEYRAKYRSTSLEKYGVDNYNKQHISPDVLEKLENIDWLTEKAQSIESVKSISSNLGISVTTLYRRFSRNGIIPRRFKASSIEEEIREFLQDKCDNIILGDRTLISPKEIDIYLPDYKLAIEVNGTYWHSELNGKGKNYHLNKTNLCYEKDVNLIHILDTEWKYKTEIVKSILLSRLGKLDRVFARKCKLMEVSKDVERNFLDTNHIQGYVPSKQCYGLFFDKELVSLMSFGNNRYRGDSVIELLRFSNKLRTTVLGGATKLFSHFIDNNAVSKIISYSHKDKFTGAIYTQMGFAYTHTSSPAYYYTQDYERFENRLKFQKHKLPSLLDNFDNNLSEWQNMQNNGYDRIWDCGNDVWEWSK